MFDISNLKTIFDVVKFTVDTMRDSYYTEDEIKEYISDSVKENSYNIIELSKGYLEECDNLLNKDSSNLDDSWRDCYYSSIYNDDIKLNGDEEFYEGFSSCDNFGFDSLDDEWDFKERNNSAVHDPFLDDF